MELIDTHCHIQSIGQTTGEDNTIKLWQRLGSSPEEVISAANNAHVKQMVCVGCDVTDSALAIAFANRYDPCYAAIGIHPHEAKRYFNNSTAQLEFKQLATSSKVVAIGECGLDYFYNHSDPSEQLDMLKFQLDLAIDTGLPVIFHVRQAFDDFWPLFDTYAGKLKGVLHSFTDNKLNLEAAIERGLFIGVNGIATFAKEPAQLEVYKAIPTNHLLLETDSPYLTPIPYRGIINEPKHVLTVAEFMARLRGEALNELAERTTANARLLFGL